MLGSSEYVIHLCYKLCLTKSSLRIHVFEVKYFFDNTIHDFKRNQTFSRIEYS